LRAIGDNVKSGNRHNPEVSVSYLTAKIIKEVGKAIVGKDVVLEKIMASILAGGHIILEDYPGLAKTLIANSFASVLSMSFRRIQFTPDLLPGDITGGYVYDRSQNQFALRKGPIFANLVLADEINRRRPRRPICTAGSHERTQVTWRASRMKLPPIHLSY
jgi:MoxR-like ATPase